MKSDPELLRQFSESRDQAAFAELVRRHVDLVYSAAVRQVNGDFHLAHDVVQQVFIDLARKAKPLSTRASLLGWLYTSALYAGANRVRSECRRRTHEQQAAAMQSIDHEENNRPDWERLRPVLDEAMLELDETDRDAVLRRFFSGESFATIGDALELSHEAARKRVDRALDRLHRLLARRGITSSATALGMALSQHAVSAAPAELGAAVAQAAFSSGGLVAAGGFFLMNKLAVGFAAAVAAGLVALLVFENQSKAQLEHDVYLQAREMHALQASVAEANTEAATPAAKLVEKPAAPREIIAPITPRELARIDASYAGMFRRLRLDREKLTALKTLLARRGRGEREIMTALKARGRDTEDLKRGDLWSLKLIAARDVDAEIRVLLGDAGLNYVQTYERTLPHRFAFLTLEEILNGYGAPLSPEQYDQLVTWTADGTDPEARLTGIPVSAVTQAAGLLSPLQLEKLKLVQAASSAMNELVTINQAAAASGKLRLVPQSAREYAEWARKLAPAATPSP